MKDIIYIIIILIIQVLYILYDLINHYNLLKEDYEALNLNKEIYDKFLEAEILENLKRNKDNKGDTYPLCIKSSPNFFTVYIYLYNKIKIN